MDIFIPHDDETAGIYKSSCKNFVMFNDVTSEGCIYRVSTRRDMLDDPKLVVKTLANYLRLMREEEL